MRRKSLLSVAVTLVTAVGIFSAVAAQAVDSPTPDLKSGEHQASTSWETPGVSAGEIRWESVLMRKAAQGKRTHTVEPGETLADIAKRYGVVDANGDGDYLRLFYANPQIKVPWGIEPGWQIRIPLPDEQLAVREVPRPIVPRGPPTGGGSSSVSAEPLVVWNGEGIPPILLRIRGCESYWDPNAPGNYTATNPDSTASGAYQFLDSTWAGRYGVPRAMMATPAQQDAAAIELYNSSGTTPWRSSVSCWG